MRARNGVSGILVLLTAIACSAGVAAAQPTCNRIQQFPGQTLHWICAQEAIACGTGESCTSIHASGTVAWSDCRCLRDDRNLSSYGMAANWLALNIAGAVMPNSSATFTLIGPVTGVLTVFPESAILLDGTVTQAQEFADTAALGGSFTLAFGSGPADSIPVTFTSLEMTVASFDVDGTPTGANTITLAPGGTSVVGRFDQNKSIVQFDAPVPCVVTNALWGTSDFFFRPILVEPQPGKAGARGVAQQVFEWFPFGRFAPDLTVPVERARWGTMKRTYR